MVSCVCVSSRVIGPKVGGVPRVFMDFGLVLTLLDVQKELSTTFENWPRHSTKGLKTHHTYCSAVKSRAHPCTYVDRSYKALGAQGQLDLADSSLSNINPPFHLQDRDNFRTAWPPISLIALANYLLVASKQASLLATS
jgi:hypothetical protein